MGFFLADCECFLWTHHHIRTFDDVSFSAHDDADCQYKLLTNREEGIDPFLLTGFLSATSTSIIELDLSGTRYRLRADRVLVVDDVAMARSYEDDSVTLIYLPDGSSVSV